MITSFFKRCAAVLSRSSRKTRMRFALPSCLKAAFLALLAAQFGGGTTASAQPDKNNNPERPRVAGEEPGRFQRPQLGGGPAGRFVPGIERLQSILSDEQRASLREVMQGQREKMRDLEEKIRDARKDLLTAGLTDKFDEDAVRQKALGAAKLEA